MAFGRKWISHLTSFTMGVISDNIGQVSNPILFKIDIGSDVTIIHLSDIAKLQYTIIGPAQIGSVGGSVDRITLLLGRSAVNPLYSSYSLEHKNTDARTPHRPTIHLSCRLFRDAIRPIQILGQHVPILK